MSTKKNKVKFNICNVHYALITVDDDGEETASRPIFMRMGTPIIRSPITWAMKGIWNWPWCQRVSGRMC